MPSIAIITVNLNDRAGLERTLQSVLAQEEVFPEIIVIDGNSTDGSQEVIERYKDRLTYWVSEPDSGIYQAMNKGIEQARADYLLFLNSGDYLVDDRNILLEVSHKLNTDIVAFDCHIADSGVITGKREHRGNPSLYYVYKKGLKHQSTFVRRKLFDRIGLYNETYRISGDYEFWVRSLLDPRTTISFMEKTVAVFELGGISQHNVWGNEHRRVEAELLPHLIADFKLYEQLLPFQNSKLLRNVKQFLKYFRKLKLS